MKTALLRSLCFLALLAAIPIQGSAAQLRVKGVVTDLDTRQPLKGVFVRVYRNGKVVDQFHTGADGQYNVRLENGGELALRFSMHGRVSKCFSVDTQGPEWEGDTKVVSVDIEMTLFERVPGVDFSVFDMPMGRARFTPMTGYLKWDKTYEEWIQPKVAEVMAQVSARKKPANTMLARRHDGRASQQP